MLLSCSPYNRVSDRRRSNRRGGRPDPVNWHLAAQRLKVHVQARPAFMSQVRTYSQSGQSITLVVKTVGADEKKRRLRWPISWTVKITR